MHLKQEYRYEQIIKKSQFIACLKPIHSENNMIQRSSDNKEPAGTAGVPMLEAILKSDIQDVCACVVRYFGGIKLGAGGLIRAYSSSVSTALQQADKVVDVIFHQYSITWLRRNTNVVDYMYDEQVTCLFETESKEIETEIQNLTSGKCTAEYIKDVKREKDI